MARHLIRYTVAFHRNGKRERRAFGTLEQARAEAQSVAKQIQDGRSMLCDINPAQRAALLACERMLAPLVSVVEEYTRCRSSCAGPTASSSGQKFP